MVNGSFEEQVTRNSTVRELLTRHSAEFHCFCEDSTWSFHGRRLFYSPTVSFQRLDQSPFVTSRSRCISHQYCSGFCGILRYLWMVDFETHHSEPLSRLPNCFWQSSDRPRSHHPYQRSLSPLEARQRSYRIYRKRFLSIAMNGMADSS
jgi:hypothetical protein